MDSLTDLLRRARSGDPAARETLFTVTYAELSAQARGVGRDAQVDTTLLVHECFADFLRTGRLAQDDRTHFFAYAAPAVRAAIVDFVRERSGSGAGNAAVHARLAGGVRASDEQIMKINEALRSLQDVESTLVRVVEMRFFAGMTELEVADALGGAHSQVWEKAALIVIAVMR